jgi:hypothetical protein
MVNNPDYFGPWRLKKREWARTHPSYWKTYRQRHPAYADQHRLYCRLAMRYQRKMLIKKDGLTLVLDDKSPLQLEFLFTKQNRMDKNSVLS